MKAPEEWIQRRDQELVMQFKVMATEYSLTTAQLLAVVSAGVKTPTTALLPCPFCGQDPKVEEINDEDGHNFFVTCVNQDCPACSVLTVGDTQSQAAELWNTRNGGAA